MGLSPRHEPGEVQTRAPPSTIVVEHGGYPSTRLLIDHQSSSVQVDQVRAWRVAAPGGPIDVYASPRARAYADEAADAWVREAAERMASSARWGPGVGLPGDPTMLMPERRLELDLMEAAPACGVDVRLEGTPTRSATTACEARSVRAALLREVEGLAR